MRKSVVIAVVAVAVAAIVVSAIAIAQSTADRPGDMLGAPPTNNANVEVPNFLLRSFPVTDWSMVDPTIERVVSGGPPKDRIPAIDEPHFIPIRDFAHSDAVRAILVEGTTEVKAYPYNILVWHEIVNDTIDGAPVAVTFCPLCGSAIVYDRLLPDGSVTTFGVSGALFESNMIMFDRETETLWQQSTGRAIAGEFLGEELVNRRFQLLTVGEISTLHPDALIQSDATGHARDYSRNPYAGYDESTQYYFPLSATDETYPAKDIFVAFSIDDAHVAAPWLALQNGSTYSTTVGGRTVTLTKDRNELEITDDRGASIPFYFEMWFSWALQNNDAGVVFDPR